MGQPGLNRKTAQALPGSLDPATGLLIFLISLFLASCLPTEPAYLFLHHYFLLIKLILKLWEPKLITIITNWILLLSPSSWSLLFKCTELMSKAWLDIYYTMQMIINSRAAYKLNEKLLLICNYSRKSWVAAEIIEQLDEKRDRIGLSWHSG